MMTLKEHEHGYTCVDDERIVAVARPLEGADFGYWRIRLHGASWIACREERENRRNQLFVLGRIRALAELRALCKSP